jgi:aryl-alcohol dehydrogenase-like predicted oxidoreductase
MSDETASFVAPTLPGGARRLALGTVQFGLPYGLANKSGQIRYEEAESMLLLARSVGIDTLDTAVNYGEAESTLGRIGVSGFNIVTKIPAIGGDVGCVDGWIEDQLEGSLTRLRVRKIGALLLHSPDDLLSPMGPHIARGLRRVKDSGLVERIGLSVYSPEQLAAVIELLPVDVVQIPFNVFDRRFAESGWLSQLVLKGVEVHARSLFLQGLLLMRADAIPPKFAPFREAIDRWHNWVESQAIGRTPVQACLSHVASYSSISRMVVGADSLEHLRSIIVAAGLAQNRAPPWLSSQSETLINPSKWSLL